MVLNFWCLLILRCGLCLFGRLCRFSELFFVALQGLAYLEGNASLLTPSICDICLRITFLPAQTNVIRTSLWRFLPLRLPFSTGLGSELSFALHELPLSLRPLQLE
uniref:Secreted protein n=1 Tax=Arundo donax TaxID=35708 RepID=A0A0A9DN09_ARUDO